MDLGWNIIKRFSENDNPCFSLDDVKTEFSAKNITYLVQVLSKMVDEHKLIRLSRGLYYIVPLDQKGETYIPNWHLVAKYLMKEKDYYIGYYSAMQIHSLITQPSLTEIIVTDTQVKPSKIEIKGTRFQFVYHNKKRFFGSENTWIDNYNKVQCSSIEKTLVDSFINPHYSGGIVEIAKAVYETKDKVSIDRLFEYFTRANSKVAARRYVYICDLLEIGSAYHTNLLELNLTGTILKLDTSLPDEGKINTHYGLKINRDPQTIKESIYS
jgi:predicted transcriptional regulator of viral defense system